MKRKRIIKLINVILIAVFLISAFNIGRIYYNYNKIDNTYADIQNAYVSAVATTPATEPSVPTEPQETQASEPAQTEATEPAETEPVPPPITVDFEALLARNKDVVGWIYCPDTVINYPVVQGKDNDQYLLRDLDGKYLSGGTLFADYRNGALGEDANYIIYGHNMKSGTMFNTLAKYKDPAFYEAHPVMYYLTPDGNYKLELFAGLVVKRNDMIYLPTQSTYALHQLLKDYRANSTFQSDMELTYDDIIVTLSTCSYEFNHARYIVIGKLTPM